MTNTEKTIRCPECGAWMTPVYTKENELDPKTEIPTGRSRIICEHMTCENCGHIQYADSDFLAGSWS